ncbi:hypothetical protein BDZ94DRAFT_1305320 [Collybia nuda]|uniref:Uncharacterized protein n=1 Tax=Collybia nuda TaxID=64659 RepID=A0A9P5YCT9_9AGAR|nr:hypothetical protein BDZ94DRAFT_1305320 [Collybia nuda]
MVHLTGSPSFENDIDFVVHNYGLFRQTQDLELLTLGRDLICVASTRTKEWTNVCGALLKPSPSFSIYQYGKPPIIATDEQITGQQIIREWGIPPQKDEDFTLNDLDDFASTSFTFLHIQRSPTSGADSPVATDKLKLNLDLEPLHNVVPQPHIHPSLHTTLSKSIKVLPYKRRKPIPIPPHTLPLPSPSPYARSAWVVPIRGSLPWEGCTSAVILDSSGILPYPSQQSEEPIVWTHSSLVSFWAFLLNLRTACNVGPIGLSFHTSRPLFPQGGSSYNLVPPISGSENQMVYELHTTANTRSTASPTPSRPPLSNVDYIKIYHEAPLAMYVRNALHVWAYQSDTSTDTKITHEKIRILKGARLVLVDERAKGILIS